MDEKHKSNYGIFGAMILTSIIVMYGLTYLNSYDASHVYWSETRFFMTLMMGASMAVIMLTFMLNMYKNKVINAAIYAGSVIVFLVALFLVRSQITVEDQSWMRAMIPHHSIAILTSENATIDDMRVQELANEIIAAQEREILEMEWLIQDIRQNGLASTESDAQQRPVPDFGE